MCSALNNASLVSGIEQASPKAQTSSLEGFHSTLNQFAPKMIAFSFIGMYCRLVIQSVFIISLTIIFNYNAWPPSDNPVIMKEIDSLLQ